MNNPIDELLDKWSVRIAALQAIDTPNSRVEVHELGMCIEALRLARKQELAQFGQNRFIVSR